MRELREDARLPWRMIAQMMGVSRNWAYQTYAKLKKVYDQ